MFATRVNMGPRLPSFSELVSSIASPSADLHQNTTPVLPRALHPHPANLAYQTPYTFAGPAPTQTPLPPVAPVGSNSGSPTGSPLEEVPMPNNAQLFRPPSLPNGGSNQGYFNLMNPSNSGASNSSSAVTPPSVTPTSSVSSYSSNSINNVGPVAAYKTEEPRLLSKRKHVCKTCGRSFTTSGHLARHFRTHTGERKHVCPWAECGARFARQDNCMQHYKTHLNGKSKRSR